MNTDSVSVVVSSFLSSIDWRFEMATFLVALFGLIGWRGWTCNRRMEARYEFYPQLQAFIAQLRFFITDSKNPKQPKPKKHVWFLLSSENRKQVIDPTEGTDLQKLASIFFEFLGNPKNVHPTCWSRKKWKKQMGLLRTYLIHFKSIGTTTNLPQYETIEKIKDEHRKLTEILNWIDGKIL